MLQDAKPLVNVVEKKTIGIMKNRITKNLKEKEAGGIIAEKEHNSTCKVNNVYIARRLIILWTNATQSMDILLGTNTFM